MKDTIGMLNNSTIHFGSFNDRVYLMKLDNRDYPGIVEELKHFAGEKQFSKIFCKVPSYAKDTFENSGYVAEGEIPGFFGNDSCYFMSLFMDPDRGMEVHPDTVKEVLDASFKAKEQKDDSVTLPAKYSCERLTVEDAPAMADVYKAVFKTYPFPIHDPEYLVKMMGINVRFFGIKEGNTLTAVSSAEFDQSTLSVEMTDFATLPEYRGSGFATFLLEVMEQDMKEHGFVTAFTIARAMSFGMNITFARRGYEFGGTLTNNTQISGNIESMNIWHKKL